MLSGYIIPHRGHDGLQRPANRRGLSPARRDPDAALTRRDGGAVPSRGCVAPGGAVS